MLGLVKKDFLLLKANLKTMIIIFIVYLIMIVQGSFDATFVVPLIGIMLFISTFSYDDFNKWNSYAITLPNGRKNVVKAKYVASIILTVILAILGLLLSVMVSYIKTNGINLDETISSLMVTILSSVIIISFLYPIIFKFGATNGRIIMFAFVFGIAAVVGLIANFVDMSFAINLINKLDNCLYIAIPLISVILLGVSYLISNRIYQNKEF